MSCCRSRAYSPSRAPALPTTSITLLAASDAASSSVCTRLRLEGTSLQVTLRQGLAYVINQGETIELDTFLTHATACEAGLQGTRALLQRIYQTAKASGLIDRLIQKHGTLHVTLAYLQAQGA